MRAVRYLRRNWELSIQIIIVTVFVSVIVADHYGKASLDSGTVGTTIVGLLFFAAVQLTRQRDELGSVRQHQLAEGEIRQISGDRIGEALEQLLSGSNQWHFRGGSGRWQLETVLPELSARRDLPSRYVMQIIDPLDDELCERYGHYRARSRMPDQAPSVSDGPRLVRHDILACIYAAGWYRFHSQIRPELTLLRTYSPLRIDCGNSGLMVTIANKAAPGLWAASGTWYYRSVVDELEQLEEVSRRLKLPREESVYPASLSAVTGDNVMSMLALVKSRQPNGDESDFLTKEAGIAKCIDYDLIASKVKS